MNYRKLSKRALPAAIAALVAMPAMADLSAAGNVTGDITGQVAPAAGAAAGAAADLAANVQQRLHGATDLDADNIKVSTVKGVVTLTGETNSAAEAHKAGQLAASVESVTEVRNRIEIAGR